MSPKSNASRGYFRASFELPNVGLRAYFGRVRKGEDEIYDTPFARGESTQQMLSEWMHHLESLRTRWPSLYAFENDLAKKVGPMSVMKPLSERVADIDHYYEGILLPSIPISRTAVSAVITEWARLRGLEVRSQARTIELMKKSTNSGSPYFTKRRNVLKQTAPCTVSYHHDRVVQDLADSQWYASAILGWRGQEGGPEPSDVKQRVVWMFPAAVNICELQVYQPLIEAAQRFNVVPAWVSMDMVDREITALFDSKSDDDLVVCTDFSKFDQHFNAHMQNTALSVYQALLSPNAPSKKWLEEVFPIKYMIPLAYDWDTVRFGLHGMGSGSGGTNADETIAHRALQYEAAQLNGALLNPHSMCLGDDGVLSYPGITVDDVVTAYSQHGMEMNPDKQYASKNDCVYLRRWHHKDYRVAGVCAGVYSTTRALGRLRYLERYMNPDFWDRKAVALRQLSILENVKFHPLKEEFVKFCMKRDKYRLGVDIPNFLEDIEEIAQKKSADMPDLLGYTKTLQGQSVRGISNWWIVRYLRSM